MSRSSPPRDPAFDALLEFLDFKRGLDFTGYKRASLERRIRRRMDQAECATFDAYVDYLEVHPEEYDALLDTILINVTEFFRDSETWDHLRQATLPALLADKPRGDPIRVWSAGCATGQEAYTLAMVLADILGEEELLARVKIYATDIDEKALAHARQAVFAEREIESVPAEWRERFFEARPQGHAFRKDLRRTLIFGRNNLISDAPISRLDLLVCRNTLMYFNVEAQSAILRRFHFALRDEGVLLLGRSEMLTAHRELFTTEDLMKRVFRARPHFSGRPGPGQGRVLPGSVLDDDARVQEAALDAAPQPQLVASAGGVVRFVNLSARALFGLGPDTVGRAVSELSLGRMPTDLHAVIEQALRDRGRVIVGEVPFTPPDSETRRLVVSVLPLVRDDGSAVGATVTFEDVTRNAHLQEEIDRSRNDLQAAYEELESTVDELETTNEELQSSNEELQTSNEELQSTNEELETMNEELQSTNEELGTINDELHDRTGELNQVNDFLEVILGSLGVAVAVVDRGGRVQVWNRGAEDLWGVRRDEAVAEHFLGLDIGLGPERLAPAFRSVIAGGDPHKSTLDAVNRRGKPIQCVVSVLPLVSPNGDEDGRVRGAIVLMEDVAALDAAATAGDGLASS
jgi:two-component system, chemotaxis family, CheB/CheR fusion protein